MRPFLGRKLTIDGREQAAYRPSSLPTEKESPPGLHSRRSDLVGPFALLLTAAITMSCSVGTALGVHHAAGLIDAQAERVAEGMAEWVQESGAEAGLPESDEALSKGRAPSVPQEPEQEKRQTKNEPAATEEDAPATPLTPLNAPRCEGIAAFIITVFERSEHSVATLSTDPKSQGVRRRVGQHLGEYRVARIDYNQRAMSSAVWLEHPGGVCQVLLRDDHPFREGQQRAAQKRQERKERARKAKAAKRRKARAKKRKRRARARKRRTKKRR